MPNYCENELTVTGPNEDVSEFSKTAGNDLDFNRFVPYPNDFKTLKCAKCGKLTPLTNDDDIFKRGPCNCGGQLRDGFNRGGLEWRIKHWGTKWNAIDTKVEMTTTGVKYAFNTAWSPPVPVVRAMAKMHPKLTFTLRYWESGMGYKGTLSLRGNKTIVEEDGEYHGTRGG